VPSDRSLTLRPLQVSDAADVAALIAGQTRQYSRFFYAIDADETAIAELLRNVRSDVYAGIYWRSGLVGIYMLRGWDAGFEIPSFGVLIDERYRGLAFMRLTLEAAKLIARLSETKKIMAKIHPDNLSPLGAKRLGFHQTGVEESTGNIIYLLEL
jgi:hypothetical protein